MHVIVGISPIHAEYTSMLVSVHAIRGSASAPTAEHRGDDHEPRVIARASRTAGFIGALVKRFRHVSDLFLHLAALHSRKTKPKPRPCHCPRETKTHVIVVYRRVVECAQGHEHRRSHTSGSRRKSDAMYAR